MSNALLASLTSALGDGIMPEALQGVMTGEFDVSASDLDLSGAQGITAQLDNLDLGNLTQSIGSVQQSGLASLAGLPGVGSILAPVTNVLSLAGQLESADVSGIITRLQETAENANIENALGLTGIDGPIRQILDLDGGSPLAGLVNLGSSLLPVNIENSAQGLLGKWDGITNAIKVIGSLMSIHARFEAISEFTGKQNGLFVRHEIQEQLAAMVAWHDNTSLATEIGTVAAGDNEAIRRTSGQVQEFISAIQTVTWDLQRSLGFADAAITQAGIDRLGPAIDAVSTILRQTNLGSTAALATTVRDWLAEHLPADFGSPAASISVVINDLQAMADELAGQVHDLPVDQITRPVTNAVGQVTSVVSELNNALAVATGAIRSVFEEVRQLIASLNLDRIAETIAATLRPIVQAVQALESFIAEISARIEEVMGLAVAAVRRVKEGILAGAGAIADTFVEVENLLAALKMEELIQGLQSGIQSVVDLLKKVDLDPYFDTAVDAMDTVSSVIAAVPLDLLPDDMEQDLQNAVQPVKAINFDSEVREVLVNKLDDILEKLDTDILGEIDRMAKEIIAFLQEHDPTETLDDLETRYFDPMLEKIQAVNPEELLRPVTEVIEQVKERINELDIRALVLDKIDVVFDDIIAYYDQCDPEPLLAPMVDQVDAFRARIIELTGIDSWTGHINTLQEQLNQGLDRLDFGKIINDIDAVYTSLLRTLGHDADSGNVMGGLIAGLLGGDMTVRASSYTRIMAWISGAEDGVEVVHDLITRALEELRATMSLVDTLEPAQAAAQVMPCYRGIRQALEALEADHPLRVQLLPLIVANSPTDQLAAVVANLPAYRGKLEGGIRSLEQLATSGFSQITAAAQALREALLPLTDVKWKLIVLVRRFGVDPVGKPLLEVIGEILAALRPGRALEPFGVVVEALKAKINELAAALVTPVNEAISRIRGLLDTMDIRLISDEMKAVHTRIRNELMAFRPSELLAAPLDAFDGLRAGIADFDPFAPVRTAIDEFKAEAAELLGPDSLLRPSVLFAGLLEQYQRILALAAQLNVRDALRPVLAELDIIIEQLDLGLSETGESFRRLQEALP